MKDPLKVAVVVGEVSGDMLAADLIDWMRRMYDGEIELIGVGGDALEARGLKSFFDFSELSIMGISQVLKRLPQLLMRIRETAKTIVTHQPDVLLIVDSPDFTHRVAKAVRKELPNLPVVNYVCPSVWAWKEYRAPAMLSYVDLVLALLPFEPAEMKRLGGPETKFVGHRLTADPDILRVREERLKRSLGGAAPTVLLLPGSRSTEIRSLLPVLKQTAELLHARNPQISFLLPTVSRQLPLVKELLEDWPVQPRLTSTVEEKWVAFSEADMALAASGTVILELALCGVPTVSMYKTDWLMGFFLKRIKVWSAALPNLIADEPIIPEHLNEMLRPGYFARWAEVLSTDTLARQAMLSGFNKVWATLSGPVAPGESGATYVLDLLQHKGSLA